MNRMEKDLYYCKIAETVTARATCLRRRYGAIVVKNDEIISTGYNGAERGAVDCLTLGKCPRQAMCIPSGQRYELCRSVHAEQNAIISAARKDMIGATIYICGIEADGSGYADPHPCLLCRRFIVNAGIVRCVGLFADGPHEIPLDDPMMPEIQKALNEEMQPNGGGEPK